MLHGSRFMGGPARAPRPSSPPPGEVNKMSRAIQKRETLGLPVGRCSQVPAFRTSGHAPAPDANLSPLISVDAKQLQTIKFRTSRDRELLGIMWNWKHVRYFKKCVARESKYLCAKAETSLDESPDKKQMTKLGNIFIIPGRGKTFPRI